MNLNISRTSFMDDVSIKFPFLSISISNSIKSQKKRFPHRSFICVNKTDFQLIFFLIGTRSTIYKQLFRKHSRETMFVY